MMNKAQWIDEIKSIAPDFRIDLQVKRLNLEAPQFTCGQWDICIEKRTKFKTVVLRWLGVEAYMPCLAEEWKVRSEIDLQNGWRYRIKLEPKDLRSLLVRLTNDFESQVMLSMKDASQARMRRLEKASKVPRKIEVTTTVFERNPDVVAEALFRANGRCQECEANAPFVRRSDNSPYLEVHHRIPLSAGGEDSVENAIALCPNCHRKLHYA